MDLWMFLLLELGLAVHLPAPSSVSISSFNMEHTLTFLPAPHTPPNATFTVQVRRRGKWKTVAGCSQLTTRHTCNLTHVFKEQYDEHQARVRAATGTGLSNWTVSTRFQPISDTVIGPPTVSVSGCGNCLLLQVRVPTNNEQLLALYSGLKVHVLRVRDGTQFVLDVPYKDKSVITYLQPGVEYCLTVALTAIINSNSVPSQPACAFTSRPASRSIDVVLGLLAAFGALGVLLVRLVLWSQSLTASSEDTTRNIKPPQTTQVKGHLEVKGHLSSSAEDAGDYLNVSADFVCKFRMR